MGPRGSLARTGSTTIRGSRRAFPGDTSIVGPFLPRSTLEFCIRRGPAQGSWHEWLRSVDERFGMDITRDLSSADFSRDATLADRRD